MGPYETVFYQSKTVNLLIDPKTGDVVDANDSACSFYGYDCEELKGKTIHELNTLSDAEVADEMKAGALEMRSSFRFRHRLRSGEIREVEVYSSPVEVWGRTLLHSVVFDITERKRKERELAEANELLERTNKTKDKLFSIIAHDLKRPFLNIMNLASLLHDGTDRFTADELEELFATIHGSAESTYGLLENLLEWARTQADHIEYNPVSVKLKLLFNDVLDLHALDARNKRLTVESDIDEGCTVRADWDMLHTILRNLLSNAVKFTEAGGRIRLSATDVGGKCRVSVEDDGVGMTPKEKEHLFSFTPAERRSGTEDELGAGLGLVVAKEFAERHGTSITVESTKGEGSRFSLELEWAAAGDVESGGADYS